MEYRRLGATDLNVSCITFGCWQLSDPGPYGYTEADAIRSVREAMALGINFFDTASWYGDGNGERLLAKALGSDRSDVYIATKVGLHKVNGQGMRDSRPARILSHIDIALRNLRTDYVDLYQIHWPDPFVPFEESWAAMCKVLESGKARYIGVSNFTAEQIARCLHVGPVHSLQPCYHLFRRDLETSPLPLCRQHHIGVMPYGPLAHGMLTGKYDPAQPPQWPPGDWRADMPIFNGDGYRHCALAVRRLDAWARERGKTVAQLAIAWALNQPGIHTVITGARSQKHLTEQVGGVNWQLDANEKAFVETVLSRVPDWRALGGDPEHGGNLIVPVEARPRIA